MLYAEACADDFVNVVKRLNILNMIYHTKHNYTYKTPSSSQNDVFEKFLTKSLMCCWAL